LGDIRLVGVGLVQDVLDSLLDWKVVSTVFWGSRGGEARCTGVDGVGVLVGNLNAEFLLNGHDDLNGVKRIKTEVVGEVSAGTDLRMVR
jgi:hypothetical protein